MEEKLVLGFWYQEKRGSISCTNKFSCVVDLHLVPLLACKHRRTWVIYWKDYFGNIFTTTYNHLFCINIDLILCIICFWISQKQSRYHVILETSSLGKILIYFLNKETLGTSTIKSGYGFSRLTTASSVTTSVCSNLMRFKGRLLSSSPDVLARLTGNEWWLLGQKS